MLIPLTFVMLLLFQKSNFTTKLFIKIKITIDVIIKLLHWLSG